MPLFPIHALLCILAGLPAVDAEPAGPAFEIRFTPEVLDGPFTGRVLVLLSKTEPEPRSANGWVRLDPVVGLDVRNALAEEPIVLHAGNAESFPVPLPDLEGGVYFVQAVFDRNRDHFDPGTAPGNPCSAPVRVELHPYESTRVQLLCDRVVPSHRREDTLFTRQVEIESELLSAFHGKPVAMRALVHLPQAWIDEPERSFPLYVFLSGYGATIEGFELVDWPAHPLLGEPMIMVYPDPSCANGHSAFCDSDNNGPWGRAFVRELLPAIEARFRGYGEPETRFLVGHSSGGWAALWLAATYPEAFGYAWASSPDPVDFRDFMGVDLYAPDANLFHAPDGRLRPFCQLGNVWTVGYTKESSEREEVVRGGVLRSFEALFGPRGSNGAPVELYDRRTGAVDPMVARVWSRYDLSRLLVERWHEIGPRLGGRIAVTVGDKDNYLLQGSVALLGRELEAIDADVRVHSLSGDHFSVRSYEQGRDELAGLVEAFREWEASRVTAALRR